MIRNLEERDLEQALKLLEQLTVVGENFDYLSVFKAISENNDHHIFVYIFEKKVVGIATIFIEQKFIHSGKRVGHIEDVVVDKDHRDLKIGTKLLKHCIETGKQKNCYKIILDCDDKNVEFYTKNGFIKYGNSMKINF